MAPDPLSEILALAGARSVITGELRAGGRWSVRFATDAPVKLDAVVRGSCWLVADDDAPVRLATGDAVVLNGVGSMVLCSDPHLTPVPASDTISDTISDTFPGTAAGAATARYGDGAEDDVLILGGHVALDPATAGIFTSALPRVTRASAPGGEAEELRRLLDRIIDESVSGRPGAQFARDQHAQLLLLEALRLGLRHEMLTHPGWLRLAADPGLRPATALIHSDPARAWGLAELAAAAGMSRSHFAHRFRQASGQPPLTYLTHWRIQLARRELRRTDVTVAVLAQRLGYSSESSFSHAFTRVTGTSPSRYRRQVHAAWTAAS